MKKEYVIPYTEIVKFQEDDFIVTSDGGIVKPDPEDWEKLLPPVVEE